MLELAVAALPTIYRHNPHRAVATGGVASLLWGAEEGADKKGVGRGSVEVSVARAALSEGNTTASSSSPDGRRADRLAAFVACLRRCGEEGIEPCYVLPLCLIACGARCDAPPLLPEDSESDAPSTSSTAAPVAPATTQTNNVGAPSVPRGLPAGTRPLGGPHPLSLPPGTRPLGSSASPPIAAKAQAIARPLPNTTAARPQNATVQRQTAAVSGSSCGPLASASHAHADSSAAALSSSSSSAASSPLLVFAVARGAVPIVETLLLGRKCALFATPPRHSCHFDDATSDATHPCTCTSARRNSRPSSFFSASSRGTAHLHDDDRRGPIDSNVASECECRRDAVARRGLPPPPPPLFVAPGGSLVRRPLAPLPRPSVSLATPLHAAVWLDAGVPAPVPLTSHAARRLRLLLFPATAAAIIMTSFALPPALVRGRACAGRLRSSEAPAGRR